MSAQSGGNQYVHKDSIERQDTLNQCFRHSTAEGFRKSAIIEACGEKKGRPFRILEIGCGSGAGTIDLARILPTAEITAVDNDASLITSAKDRLDPSSSPDATLSSRISFRILNGEEVGSKFSGEFDAVWFRFVLVHVPRPLALLKSAIDCLRSAGTLFVEDCDSRGEVNDPPFLANQWLHRTHEEVSLRLGGDVRRGSRIGRYLSESFGHDLTDVQFDRFIPIYGKGVKMSPWSNAPETSLGKVPSTEEQFELGMALFKGTLKSLTPKFLELGLCTQSDVDLAWESVEQVNDGALTPYQLFSMPGGVIYQWWATKV